MHVTHIAYKRVTNLGSHETVTIEATAVVENGEHCSDALAELRDWVELQIQSASDLALQERRARDEMRMRDRAALGE